MSIDNQTHISEEENREIMRRIRLKQQARSIDESQPNFQLHLHTMERSRSWTRNDNNKESVSELLGTYSRTIEELLKDGKTILEVGAGNFETSVELSRSYPQCTIIAVEPFPSAEKLLSLPQNVIPITSKIEDLPSDIVANLEISACFGAWVIEYATDKLALIKKIYDLLQDDGVAFLQFGNGHLTSPSLTEIIIDLHLEDQFQIVDTSEGSKVLIVKKNPTIKVVFSPYKLVSAPHAGGGFCVSMYEKIKN